MVISFNSVLKSEFYKYRKSSSHFMIYFALCIYAIVFACSFSVLDSEMEVGNCILNIFSNSIMTNMLVAMLIVPFAINDFRNKTIQHPLTLGASRRMIINAKLLIITTSCVVAYILAALLGLICATLLSAKGVVTISYGFMSQALVAELIFLIVFVLLCMLFYMIVRNAAAYIMSIFSLWLSLFGALAGERYDNVFFDFAVHNNIFGQCHLMITQHMGDETYYYTTAEWSRYLLVMIISGVAIYSLIRVIFEKIEIR